MLIIFYYFCYYYSKVYANVCINKLRAFLVKVEFILIAAFFTAISSIQVGLSQNVIKQCNDPGMSNSSSTTQSLNQVNNLLQGSK